MVNVIVLFSRMEEARSIKNVLIRGGINVTYICTTGAQAIQAIDACDDGLIVCGYRYQDMIFADLRNYLPDSFDMIVVTSKNNYEECKANEVVCLTMPLKTQDFVNTVNSTVEEILWDRKRRKQRPKQRTDEEKRVIRTAKLKLMEEKGLDEEAAHKYLQQKSMNSGTDIVEMAYMVIDLIGSV